MNTLHKKKKILILTLVVLLVSIILYVVWYSIQHHNLKTGVNINYTPRDSRVLVNEKEIDVTTGDTVPLKPGEYNIKIQKSGFEAQTKKIEVVKGRQVEMNIILEPNAYYTKNWYDNQENIEDAKIRERVANRMFGEGRDEMEKNSPLIVHLPYVNDARTYRIDYGVAEKKGTQAIYISYYAESGKASAEEYIKELGYNLEDYETHYKKREYGTWWP